MATNRSSNSNWHRNLEKLSDIQADISKILAVHEQRLNQHEKVHETLMSDVEKRRIEINEVTGDLYKAIDIKTDKIMDEIKENYSKSSEQTSKLRDRMVNFEKYIWMAIGASVGLSWIFSFIVNYHNLTK
jgi:hypothetical protein